MHVRPAKTQISLRIRVVWSESSQGTFGVANDLKCIQENSEYTNQHAQVDLSLAGRTCSLVGNAVPRLKC